MLIRILSKEMNHLVFLYTILCYTFGFAAYLFAILTAVIHKKKEERLYVLFLTAFLLFLIPSLVYGYFNVAQIDQGGTVTRIFSLLDLAGIGLMIYSLPAFIHAVMAFNHARTADLAFLILAVALCVVALVFEGTPAAEVVRGLRFAVLVAVIAYSAIAGNILGRSAARRAEAQRPQSRWLKILTGVTVLTITLMPFSVLIDMFPEAIPGLSARVPLNFKVYPLCYMLWNLFYVIRTVPLYSRKAPVEGSGDAWDFARFRLSRREQEITRLVIVGLSYQQIADRLYISLATVKTHVARVFEKTGAGNKMDLANTCRRIGVAP
jgi:DNA-binding CsgD family transcriptional regulator